MKIRKSGTGLRRVSFLICLLIILGTGFQPLAAGEQKDLILVLDTSLSMAGLCPGCRNIFAVVKKSLDGYVEKLEDGDSLTFITFDAVVKVYPTVYVQDDDDIEILRKYISVTEAKGPWTFTQEMMKNVFQTATGLEKKDSDRQQVIVVLTDGLDDPPPGLRHKRLNIHEIATAYSKKDWFIYLVNLGTLKESPRLARLQKLLQENVTKYTKVVEASDEPGKVIDKTLTTDMQRDIEEKRREERGFFSTPYFWALVVLVILLIGAFLARRFLQLRVGGKLEYWDHTMMDPYIKAFDLSKYNRREVTVGRGAGNVLNIRDIEIPEPFRIVAVRDGGTVRCALRWGSAYNIYFVNREPGKFMEEGDVFKVANYTFRYNKS